MEKKQADEEEKLQVLRKEQQQIEQTYWKEISEIGEKQKKEEDRKISTAFPSKKYLELDKLFVTSLNENIDKLRKPTENNLDLFLYYFEWHVY